jgi:hypothetical protein
LFPSLNLQIVSRYFLIGIKCSCDHPKVKKQKFQKFALKMRHNNDGYYLRGSRQPEQARNLPAIAFKMLDGLRNTAVVRSCCFMSMLSATMTLAPPGSQEFGEC